jgi:uroporphyrin-III C-methyltransferase
VEATLSQTNTTSARRNGARTVFAILLLLMLLVVGAGAGALWWYLHQEQSREARLSQIELLIEKNQRAITAESTARTTQMHTADNDLKALTTQSRQMRAQLNEQERKLHDLSTTDRADWQLAEVQYLLRLANQRLLMGRDLDSALALLAAADKSLAEMDEPALHEVRAAVAKDIATLRGSEPLDVQGIYLQLAAVQGEIAKLSVRAPSFDPEAVAVESLPETAGWRDRLDARIAQALLTLKSLVTVRHHDANSAALMAPDQAVYLQLNLRLMIEQAQMALLQGKGAIYRGSLEKARDYVTQHYTIDQQRAQAVLETLSQLATQSIERPLPDISSSLKALNLYIRRSHDVPRPAAIRQNPTHQNPEKPAQDATEAKP